ncbi:MAG: TolC family protein, partial [Balneolaceae bacterium]|nr:TolC family protein [Balneolaceae bacterium]
MKSLILLTLITASLGNPAQDSLTLSYCYQKAYENYPLAEIIDLQQRITEWNVRIARGSYYPDISIGAEATYQSEVPGFTVPGGGGISGISKDQYEVSLSFRQNIYSGGRVGIAQNLEEARGEKETRSLEVEMHKIREQIDQVYFGILLSRQQEEIIDLTIKELNERLAAVRSKVKNGILLPAHQKVLEAERIKARQERSSAIARINTGYQMLGELIGEPLEPGTGLSIPDYDMPPEQMHPNRPELEFYESVSRVLLQRKNLEESAKWPSLSAFGRAAYGRPGFNFLEDEFQDYYLVGLQLQWNLRDFLNAGHRSEAIQIEMRKTEQQREAFELQLRNRLNQISDSIMPLKSDLKSDSEIFRLREE